MLNIFKPSPQPTIKFRPKQIITHYTTQPSTQPTRELTQQLQTDQARNYNLKPTILHIQEKQHNNELTYIIAIVLWEPLQNPIHTDQNSN